LIDWLLPLPHIDLIFNIKYIRELNTNTHIKNIMKIKSIILILLFTRIASASAQESDIRDANLKGLISSVETISYSCAKKFGEYVKDYEKSRSTIYYNERGNIYKEKDFKGDEGKKYYSCNYGYSNKLLNIIEFNDEDEKDTINKKVYTYLTNEKIQEINEYKYSTYQKNDDNDDKYYSDWKLESKIKYLYTIAETKINEYNEEGSLIKIITRKGNTSIERDNFATTTTTKDIFGRPIKSVCTVTQLLENMFKYNFGVNKLSRNTASSRATISIFRYNKFGDIISKIQYYKDKPLPFKYIYTYDGYNNWIIRKSYQGEDLIELDERKIIYTENK
jgi:hypothetical protein